MPGSLRHIPTRDSQQSSEDHAIGRTASDPPSSPSGSQKEKPKSIKGYDTGDQAEVVSVHSGGDLEKDQQQYKTMSWQRASGLLFGEYVCLAILSFPSAFATLGMAGGIIGTVGLGLITLYTSLKLHSYCMRHPNILHFADSVKQIFGGHWLAYEIAALVLVLNNCFLMGLHTLTVSEVINTLAEPGSFCTVGASVIGLVVCAIGTLPRKLDKVALMGIVSAVLMFCAIVLTLAFSGAQGRNPAGLDPADPVRITAFAPKGTTFVAGMNAILQILFTWVGQIVYFSFIAEFSAPEDFPKALYAVTAAEFALFLTVGIVGYWYAGQYAGAPAVTVISNLKYKKAAFAPVLVVSILIGIIYGAVVSKYIFVRIFGGTKHYASNSKVGWIGWTVIVFSTWTFGWIIGSAVPFFGLLISLMSALFDGWVGFVLPALMYFEISKGQLFNGWRARVETIFNMALVVAGLFVFGVGTYTSAQAIADSYAAGEVKAPFGCGSNGV